jgi:hypothetical protein
MDTVDLEVGAEALCLLNDLLTTTFNNLIAEDFESRDDGMSSQADIVFELKRAVAEAIEVAAVDGKLKRGPCILKFETPVKLAEPRGA